MMTSTIRTSQGKRTHRMLEPPRRLEYSILGKDRVIVRGIGPRSRSFWRLWTYQLGGCCCRAAHAVVGVQGFDLGLPPDHWPGERLDAQHHVAVLEDADSAGRLADRHGDPLGLLADAGGRPVP